MPGRHALPILFLMGVAAACATGAATVPPPRSAAAPAVVETAAPAAPVPATSDFEAKVRPLLEARCSPCHFAGGKMYAKLPFDRPETIRTLGTKLFTRIKDAEDQALIRGFLGRQAGPSPQGEPGS